MSRWLCLVHLRLVRKFRSVVNLKLVIPLSALSVKVNSSQDMRTCIRRAWRRWILKWQVVNIYLSVRIPYFPIISTSWLRLRVPLAPQWCRFGQRGRGNMIPNAVPNWRLQPFLAVFALPARERLDCNCPTERQFLPDALWAWHVFSEVSDSKIVLRWFEIQCIQWGVELTWNVDVTLKSFDQQVEIAGENVVFMRAWLKRWQAN